jgi:hypothetical protein
VWNTLSLLVGVGVEVVAVVAALVDLELAQGCQ